MREDKQVVESCGLFFHTITYCSRHVVLTDKKNITTFVLC